MNVEPETGEALFRQRLAAGEPVRGIDRATMMAVVLGSLRRICAVRSLTAEAISASATACEHSNRCVMSGMVVLLLAALRGSSAPL
jgi:hypothetical protein